MKDADSMAKTAHPYRGGINRETRLCISLAGRPGNFGTRFHNYLYDRLGLNYLYKACTTDNIGAAVQGIRALGIRGAGISMPFKESCIPFLDNLRESASGIRSVNTIVNNDGHLSGYNTDYIAVRHLLEARLLNPHSPVVLRGSGGMGKTVAAAFRDMGFTNGVIAARNPVEGKTVADRHGWQWVEKPEPLASSCYNGSILVNVTPLGMAGALEATYLSFPESMVARASLVVEIVAMPVETPLVLAARHFGKPVITGNEVSALQALEQFVLYTGVRPENDLVADAARFANS
ncbi:shikimate 5-dehydrogenase [Acetobacter sp.]|jgi:shikimate dehydrogenase|uniref:shikimate 5-dehydrogenase n=1 Tax=Acetobacter sp. TaxID=440 RepID=UPI0025C628CD|nr:shikimate 5-dehydrogenase [Acetobacter sp.]MCH4089761.1 shikimate 5-dehydrogenase [Acetobacter sp.]MCI1298457.1 shikimate 5-dehydrogenase [Acetobacter sp.]MCI1316413.1 shikimate 5-dehydrogenase [Acetobacter sp.]